MVDQYCHVSAGGGRYSVPSGLMGRRGWVALGARTVEVVHDGGRVASHVRVAEGDRSTRKDHITPRHTCRAEWTAERIRREAGTVGEGAAALLGACAGTEQALRSCHRLLRLEGTCGRERLGAACAQAMSVGSPKVSSVESTLRNGLDRRPACPPPEPPRREHGNIRDAAYFS